MADYFSWNDALAKHFFNSEAADSSVYLYVNEPLITELGSPLGSDLDDFIAAVKTGPPWATRHGICQKALQAFEGWRARNLPYPPYIAYLSLFVLAAGVEGECAPHAYYPRLRALLGDTERDMLPSFDRVLELWDDLERWSTHDKHGALGLFEARIAGSWIHVGLPIAQTILSAEERKSLPTIFREAAFDPTSPPPDAELLRALRRIGGAHFRRRTLDLLEHRHDVDLLHVLLDLVADQLAAWDGQVEEATGDGVIAEGVYGALRLCLAFEPVAGRVRLTLRARLNREFPDVPLVLAGPGLSSPVTCQEYLAGWSSPLLDLTSNQDVDASMLNWSAGLTFTEEQLRWQFKLPASQVRVFVGASSERLPDLVEVRTLPRSSPFLLLFPDACWDQLRRWTQTECLEFREHHVADGLPSGWRLGAAQGAFSDAGVREHFPVLAFPEQIRLRFLGGIRSSRGSNFFAFAPPAVSVVGARGDEDVVCNGSVLRKSEQDSYALPNDLPVDSLNKIEVRRVGRAIRRQSFYLTGDFTWRWASPSETYDGTGERNASTQPEISGIAGALVVGQWPDTGRFHMSMPLELTGSATRGRTLVIGRTPGEVASWPIDARLLEWHPVWAIQSRGRKRGRVVFCGQDMNHASPLESSTYDREQIDRWRTILWHRRKRIAPPDHQALCELWREYLKVAKGV